jgi:carboxymethylenebutenolidase
MWTFLILAMLLWGCSRQAISDSTVAGPSTMDDYTEAMAREHADDHAGPNEATIGRVIGGVNRSEVVYHQGTQGPVYGFLASPDAVEPRAAVVMIHEWWGLNDNIRTMAELLASEGYTVLAIDLYEGSRADAPDQARALMSAANQRPEALQANLADAIDYLRDELGIGAVAVMGWCFGGAWTLNTAANLGDAVDAAVVYYGRVLTTPEQVAGISAPVLGIFAADDTGIPLESVKAFEAAMAEAGKDLELHIFASVGHAFANPSGNNYDAEAAEAAWELTLQFLARHFAPNPN